MVQVRRLNQNAFNPWIYNIIDDYSHRIEVYYGGAGSGKSYGAMQKVLLKAMNQKRRVLIIRKVGNTLKDSVFSLMRRLLLHAGQAGTRINRSGYEIELQNGSIFLFKGLDDAEKVKSIDGITDILIEEATELVEDDFTQLNLRLRPPEPDPQIYLMFNPVSKANWVYGYFFIDPPPDARIINTTYRDNKFLPESYVAELERLKNINPAYYRIYALGEFATLDKLVFPIIQKRLVGEDEVKGLPAWHGLDYGYTNDPSAITWGRYDNCNKRLFITGEYHRKGMTNDEIYDAVCALGLSKEVIIADSAEPKSNDELLRRGLRIRSAQKGPDSVGHGIDFMQRQEIIVDERCLHTIEEFENYTWLKDRKSGEYINKPVDAFNHHIDSIRYGLETFVRPGGKFVNVQF